MKRFKQILSAFLACIMVAMLMPISVYAANVSEKEENDTIETAQAVKMGDTIHGEIYQKGDADFYKFSLSESGKVTLDITAYMQNYSMIVFNALGNQIWRTESNTWNKEVGFRNDIYNLFLEIGNYYIQIKGSYYASDKSEYLGTYEILSSFSSANATEIEPNNDTSQANKVNIGDKVRGLIAQNGDYDFYTFTLSESGKVTLDITAYMQNYSMIVFDALGNQIWRTESNTWNKEVGFRNDIHNLFLEIGNYYIQIKGSYYASDKSAYPGTYELNTSFSSANATEVEPNNSTTQANAINIGDTICGLIAQNGDHDFYTFTLTEPAKITLDLTAYIRYLSLNIFDDSGNKSWYAEPKKSSSDAIYITNSYEINLDAGKYYLQVKGSYYATDKSDQSGTYKITISNKPAYISVKGITLNKANLSLKAGGSERLIAFIEPSNATNTKIEWSSSDAKIATVNNNGVVTGVAEGTSTITAKTVDGDYTVRCNVTVEKASIKVQGVKLDKSTLSLYEGEQATLYATVSPQDASNKNVVWSSSNKNIATVGNNGKLTAIAEGIVTITATTEDGGYTARCKVEVNKKADDTPFKDVHKSDYFCDAVTWAASNNITNGESATVFNPYGGCNRAQAVTFLWRAMGCPSPQTTVSSFSDVNNRNDYYYKAVLWAVEKGIVNGVGNGRFDPNGAVSRGMFITMLWRCAGEPSTTGSNSFTDVASGQYYTSAVQWAVGQKIISGTTETTFSPNDSCVRAHIVTILYRNTKTSGGGL